MGNIEILIFNNIKIIGGKAALDKAMKITTDYIKVNRIAFGKKTSIILILFIPLQNLIVKL